MPAHVHAANMALYAQDAAETERPWERWEAKHPIFSEDAWRPLGGPQFGWDPESQYRRKPRTIRIGEFDVPEPLREAPAMGTEYWAVDFFRSDTFVQNYDWQGDEHDCRMLRAGICHFDRQAAELHAIALIGLNK